MNVITAPSSVPAAHALGLQRSERRILLLVGDAVAAAVAMLLALWAWSLTTGFAFDVAFLRRWAAWWLIVPVWVVCLGRSRNLRAALSSERTAHSLAAAIAMLLVGYVGVYFYAPRQSLPRLPIVYFTWEAALLTIGWRLVYAFVFGRAEFRRRVMVVAEARAADEIVSFLRRWSPDVDVVAAVDETRFADLCEDVGLGTRAQEVVVDRVTEFSPSTVKALLRCQQQGVAVVPLSAEYEQLLSRVPLDYVTNEWVFTSLPETIRARDSSAVGKRALDSIVACIGLVGLIAVAPFVAVAILLDSGMPVLYQQERVGEHGRRFHVLKFRTMTADAELDGPQWARKHDPRVTRVGYWLRRSRLDELPQVLNVLKGDMSIVGPRPERPEFVSTLELTVPLYGTRFTVLPGLTGWAQVNVPYGASIEDARVKLEYDLYYIKHRSLAFDVRVIALTLLTVLGLRGR